MTRVDQRLAAGRGRRLDVQCQQSTGGAGAARGGLLAVPMGVAEAAVDPEGAENSRDGRCPAC